MFKSVNETDKFKYDDCVVKSIEAGENYISLEVEALIVGSRNSQNSNYTDSYAAKTTIRLEKAEIIKALKIGFKKYDANDKLVEAVPDEELAINALNLKTLFKDVYLNDCAQDGEICYICISGMDDDPTVVCDSYELQIKCREVSMSWERYMNKVQY